MSKQQKSYSVDDDSIYIQGILSTLFAHKLVLFLCVFLGAAVGYFLANWARPEFTSDAMIQLETTKKTMANALGDMGELLQSASPADAEMELLKSRMLLSYVVDEQKLCYFATPIGFLDRLTHKEGRMDLEELNIPLDSMADKQPTWTARILSENEFAVFNEDTKKEILRGKVGEYLKAPCFKDTFEIKVRALKAVKGQRFELAQTTRLNAIRTLASTLQVEEKGKKSGILNLTYSGRYPDRVAAVLNSVANTYLRQNVEMRGAQAEKTLEFLEEQIPFVKAKLDSAEQKLAKYRHKVGSVDISGETNIHLQKEVDLQRQILQLEQQRQEATRLFKEEHPTVATLKKQEAKLRGELKKLKKNAEDLPLTQQEIIALQEEVAMNNALYTTMLNNKQQLQVIRGGEIGNVRIVDYAQIEQKPAKPKKKIILMGGVAGGFALGCLLIFLSTIWSTGEKRASEIEQSTGLSVYAKIPLSRKQWDFSAFAKKNRKIEPDSYVVRNPEDAISDQFRALLTSISFSLDEGQRVIMISGLDAGVGKSFISENLAAVYATSGKKVLLIDADLRRGRVFTDKRIGLADVLSEKATLEQCIYHSKTEGLDTLGHGNTNTYHTELIRSKAFDNFIEHVRSLYDIVLVDTPPLTMLTDAALIQPRVDLSLVVLQYGKHSMDAIFEGISILKRSADTPIAFVLNQCEAEHGYGYYGYYSYKKKSEVGFFKRVFGGGRFF